MKKQFHNPTMMIKSKFSNLVHKIIDPCFGIKRYSREWWDMKYKQKNNPLTDKQKAEKYDEIMKVYNECSDELYNYFSKRSYNKAVQKEREKKNLVIQ
jgi:hypothetical protein